MISTYCFRCDSFWVMWRCDISHSGDTDWTSSSSLSCGLFLNGEWWFLNICLTAAAVMTLFYHYFRTHWNNHVHSQCVESLRITRHNLQAQVFKSFLPETQSTSIRAPFALKIYLQLLFETQVLSVPDRGALNNFVNPDLVVKNHKKAIFTHN